ncbi:protein-tyrosine phosphatase-like protein [Gilbertella persicaria]|uniref:protein-tyrosine phosphatase-like protein n=1 Tax=Gilbertella persicaria TaxID=101096 RepID=UPI0022204B8B|nr:protein-tyrosine phosphatase-like protein [Gilbertella persicaria]KAI8092178.1 protein-tyrosine phosphatase-like protein [Gilbertella persicaria]
MPTEDTELPLESDLYQTLECGADGKPGGILITSFGQQVWPHIWLGGYKALESHSFLKKNNITHILTLGHFKHTYEPDQFVHKIIRITDNPEANIIQYFPETVEFISHAVDKNENILVHCLAGVSRSPTVVTAYLMATQKLRYKEALAKIRQSRPFVNPNPGFIRQLKLFQDMDYTFDSQHSAYLEYKKQHPIDAGHVGHSEYE